MKSSPGQPREINFYLPAADIPLLRTLPGFEGFDPQEEVLHCDKPGTGLADAPRSFQVKLVGILTKKCGMRQSGVDNELCFRQDPSGTLICLMAINVDDLKIAGEHVLHFGVVSMTLQRHYEHHHIDSCVRRISDGTEKRYKQLVKRFNALFLIGPSGQLRMFNRAQL